ncbi:transmembrane protein, putative (macronuclear) [Tetrahymena thermophila SB210]|uniref:Transmembrane protein, putative n=1 Tax=Tetrahymena thermophila (strain SB210) TaxID=312017 RepID=W7XJW9_TETTS|nr:transmembrane protein, putative [Tetrahymena thermophila SB210]EWS76016.1 transmembrane protein, putative [Tetrahymena thermophila SB210]|eukprot:XP_012651454.1 transmembrane protein, putative [Tetrahymena thermophila SB210]
MQLYIFIYQELIQIFYRKNKKIFIQVFLFYCYFLHNIMYFNFLLRLLWNQLGILLILDCFFAYSVILNKQVSKICLETVFYFYSYNSVFEHLQHSKVDNLIWQKILSLKFLKHFWLFQLDFQNFTHNKLQSRLCFW